MRAWLGAWGHRAARLGGRGRALACLLAGVLHTGAFAPWELWPLQTLAVATLVLALQGAGARRAAGLSVCFSLGWLVSGLWWLYISMHDFGQVLAPLAALAVVLLVLFLSSHLALAMALFARWRRGRPLADAGLFALCWLGAELGRAQAFTGFPWLASGYVHTSSPLVGWAPWVGVYGLGALGAGMAAALALAGRALWAGQHEPAGAPPWRAAAPALALAAGVLALGVGLPTQFTQASGTLSVSLLQPNVPQDTKFDPDRIVGNLMALQAQLGQAQGQLVVTPESVVPLTFSQLPEGYWDALSAPFRQGERAALIGLFTGDEQRGYVNSLIGVARPAAPGAADYVYGKRHLLPFGEFVPTGFRWFVDAMAIPMADQASGTQEAPLAVGGQRVRPLICYEDLFGEDFAAAFLRPDAPTVLVNVSNLAWFGRHMIQEQHLQFSRMRALEFQRPLVRATNTGVTGLVLPDGRVAQALPGWTPGLLELTVEGRSGLTPYARWLGAWGLWPLWGMVALGLWALRRRRQAR